MESQYLNDCRERAAGVMRALAYREADFLRTVEKTLADGLERDVVEFINAGKEEPKFDGDVIYWGESVDAPSRGYDLPAKIVNQGIYMWYVDGRLERPHDRPAIYHRIGEIAEYYLDGKPGRSHNLPFITIGDTTCAWDHGSACAFIDGEMRISLFA